MTIEINIRIFNESAANLASLFEKLAIALKPTDQKMAEFVKQFNNEVATAIQKPVVTAITPSAPEKKQKRRKHGQKPDPYELVKQRWVVRGPYLNKKRGKELFLVNPANTQKDRMRYLIGKEIDDHDVMKLRALAEPNEKYIKQPHRPRKNKQVMVATTTVTAPPEPKKEEEKWPPLPAEAPKVNGGGGGACQICLNRGRPLGKCEKMGAPHCKPCHDDHCGDILYDFKVIQ